MDQEILDRYDDIVANLMEMIDAFQDDIQFRRKYSNFVKSAASTLDYIKARYIGRVNSKGELFDDWFRNVKGIKKIKGDVELTHLVRARGHDFHFAHIPTGATRGVSYSMGLTLVSEERAAKLAAEKAKDIVAKPAQEEHKAENKKQEVKTFDRWLVNEDTYMRYTTAYGKTYDNRDYIPILRSRYPAKGSTNYADIIKLCTEQMHKIKFIMDECQIKWP